MQVCSTYGSLEQAVTLAHFKVTVVSQIDVKLEVVFLCKFSFCLVRLICGCKSFAMPWVEKLPMYSPKNVLTFHDFNCHKLNTMKVALCESHVWIFTHYVSGVKNPH